MPAGRNRRNPEVPPTSELQNIGTTQTVACPLCQRADWAVIHEKQKAGSVLRFVVCECCGLVRIDPLPSREVLRQYYETQYRREYKGVTAPRLKHVYRAGRLAVSRFQDLREFLPARGEVLDVGSAGGEWLYVLRAAGFAARGIELDVGYAQHSIRELRAQVDVRSVWDADFSKSQFRAITLFHVLEHLPDPVECLTRCADWLSEDGHFIVEVPNIAAVHQHPHKRFHPAHLFGFTPASLELAGRRAGLTSVRLHVDDYERNIRAVFRKNSEACEETTECRAMASHCRAESLVKYYLRGQTYVRWLKRVSQFWTEKRAVRGRSRASDVLQEIVTSAGIQASRAQ